MAVPEPARLGGHRLPRLRAALIGMACVFVAACCSLTLAHGGERVATVWFANAIALAWTSASSKNARPAILGLSFIALLGSNLVLADAPSRAISLAALNIVEIIAASTLIERFIGDTFTVERPRHLLAFLMYAGIFAPAISAMSAGLYFEVSGTAPALPLMIRWYLADALGMMTLAPLLLSLQGRSPPTVWGRAGLRETIGFLMLLTAVATTLFGLVQGPLLFILLPFLLFAAVRTGFTGAAAAIMVATVSASVLTAYGFGPVAALTANVGTEAFHLQLLVVVAIATTLPIAALTQERDSLFEQVSRSEKRFRNLSEAAPVGIFAADARGRVTYVNQHLRDTTTWGADQLNWKAIVAPSDHKLLTSIWSIAFRDRSPVQTEFRKLDKAGAESWVGLRAGPEFDDAGNVVGWIGTIIDIDAQYRMHEALKESERLHRLLAENTNDMIVRIGVDFVPRYISPACERILGFTPDELISWTQNAAIHPEDRARVKEVYRSLLAGASQPMCLYRQLRKDGEYVWLEASYRLVRDEATGEPVEFIASVRDVSGRQRAELASAEKAARLEERDRLLQMSEAAAGVGHWRLDLVAGALFWSEEVFRIHGLQRDHVPTLENGIASYHPDDRAMVMAHLDRAEATREGCEFRARICRPDGEIRNVLCLAQVEVAPDAQVIGLFGIFQDISQQVEVERELTEARDRAQLAAESQSAFLAMMSHEIRTPMTGIVGMIELLAEADSELDRARAIKSIEQSSTMLMRVLDDVLDHLKIEAGEVTIEEVAFSLDDMLTRTVDLFQASARAKGVSIEIEKTYNLDFIGDIVRIQQIISNFISNAVKFTAYGLILIQVDRTKKGRLRISVADTGIGIEKEILPTLFKPFAQAENSTARRFGGTGLGLSISARLARAMGGSVGATSKPNEGSQFWVELPLRESVQVVDFKRSSNPSLKLTIAGRSPVVLVVEDTDTTRLVAEAHLEAMGCRVCGVENGVDALAMLASERFDLMLIDSAMPELEGAEVIWLARMMPVAELPRIVGFTAHVGEHQHRALRNAGLDGMVHKPFRAAALHEELSRVLALPSAARPKIDAFRDFTAPQRRHLVDATKRHLRSHLASIREAVKSGKASAVEKAFSGLRQQGELLGIEDVVSSARFGEELVRRVGPDMCELTLELMERLVHSALDKLSPTATSVIYDHENRAA